jgi:hypothetical protein
MNLSETLLEALRQSLYWTDKTKSNGKTIQGLTCPHCGDKSAWAYADSPMSINCNRANSCGVPTKTLELFPEVRRNIERDYPATKEDPNRPAREYLKSRGLNKSLAGLEFRYLKNARKSGSGAVMFVVDKDENGKEILNGRLFNPPPGEGKTHNVGSTAGRFWKHPGLTYDPSKPTYAVESITDALSLIELDLQAIAVLAAGQDPAKVNLASFPNKTLSFDSDEAGQRACRKWKLAYPDAEAVLCDQGHDWNDLLQTGSLVDAKKQFEICLPRYRLNGELALADSANQYAEIFYRFHQYAPGLFQFRGCTYFACLKTPRGGDGQPYVSTSRCLKGVIRLISVILSQSNPAKPEYLYVLEVRPEKGRLIKTTATGRDLSNIRNLTEFLLSYAKITWEGDKNSCSALQLMITGDKSAPEVKQPLVIGYQPDSGAYVFSKWAVDCTGKLLAPDKHGFFRIGHNQYIVPPQHLEGKEITPAAISLELVKKIYELIKEAWGFNGVIALSWTVAGWFVGEIKAALNFYPFLSTYGDPAAGKSELIILLNAIQGLEGEGLPVTQLNSKKGLIRTIGQHSGRFIALLEDNERNDRAFDYGIILPAYNKNPSRCRRISVTIYKPRKTLFWVPCSSVKTPSPSTARLRNSE